MDLAAVKSTITEFRKWRLKTVVEMSADRRDNGLGLGVVITAHCGEDGMIQRIRNVLNSGRDACKYKITNE
jgi:hypothetical protein